MRHFSNRARNDLCLCDHRKVEQVTEEVHALRISLDRFGSREQRRAAEKADREELLSRADAGRLAKQEMDAESQVGIERGLKVYV